MIGTLDAIHLASALVLKEENRNLETLFLTHDTQLATAAMAIGFEVEGLN